MSKKVSVCIICYTTWTRRAGGGRVSAEDKLEGNRSKFILHSFLRLFDIPRGNSPGNSTQLTWNFQDEDLPFCNSCKETVESLIQLQQQLESIKQAIVRVKSDVSRQIKESSAFQERAQRKKTSSGDHEKLKVSTPTTTTHTVQDRRVNLIRDLIAGPVLRVPKYIKPTVDIPTHDISPKAGKAQGSSSLAQNSKSTTTTATTTPTTICETQPPDVKSEESSELVVKLEMDSEEEDEKKVGYKSSDEIEPFNDPLAIDYASDAAEASEEINHDVEEGDQIILKDGPNPYPTVMTPKRAMRLCRLINSPSTFTRKKDTNPVISNKNCVKVQEPAKGERKRKNTETETEGEWSDEDADSGSGSSTGSQSEDEDRDGDEWSDQDDVIIIDDNKRDADFAPPVSWQKKKPKNSSGENDNGGATTKKRRKYMTKKRRLASGEVSPMRRPHRDPNRMIRRKTVHVEPDPDSPNHFFYGGFGFSGCVDTGFKCDLCPKSCAYKEKHGAARHIRHWHLDGKTQLCPECGKKFFRGSDLNKHRETHTREARVICQHCGGSYATEYLLSRHILIIHETQPEYLCETCSSLFRTEKQLARHIEKEHMPPAKKKDEVTVCKFCQCTFVSKEGLVKHMKRFHVEKLAELGLKPRTYKRNYKPKHSSKYYLKSSKSVPMSLRTGDSENKNDDGNNSGVNEGAGASNNNNNDDNGNSLESEENLRPWKCHLCPHDVSYMREMHLTFHLRQIHKMVINKRQNKKKDLTPKPLFLVCEFCNKKYAYGRKCSLIRHIAKVHPGQSYSESGQQLLQQQLQETQQQQQSEGQNENQEEKQNQSQSQENKPEEEILLSESNEGNGDDDSNQFEIALATGDQLKSESNDNDTPTTIIVETLNIESNLSPPPISSSMSHRLVDTFAGQSEFQVQSQSYPSTSSLPFAFTNVIVPTPASARNVVQPHHDHHNHQQQNLLQLQPPAVFPPPLSSHFLFSHRSHPQLSGQHQNQNNASRLEQETFFRNQQN